MQGPFASEKRLGELRALRISHILNVGESPNLLGHEHGFAQVSWLPIEDLRRIPDHIAIECLDTLHQMVCVENSKVYVHCVAGWNRSPAIVWLYLVSCGVEKSVAKVMIESRSYDAIPCHPELLDAELVSTVICHGSKRFLPHPRPEALQSDT
jgi:protein-tyrosine phosphatase